MNIIKAFNLTAVCLMALNSAETGHSQTYQQTISGLAFGLTIFDQGGSGNFFIGGATLSKTITITPNPQTIQQVGSITIPAASQTFTFHESRTVPGLPTTFPTPPNPPRTALGDLTLTVSYAGGSVPFNTGAEPFAFSSGSTWTFTDNTTVSLPVDIRYSLVTEGQTLSGDVVENVGARLESFAFDTANYPVSIDLNGNGFALQQNGTVANLTGNNGFNSEIQTVPEPSSFLLGGAGIAALVMYRRRK